MLISLGASSLATLGILAETTDWQTTRQALQDWVAPAMLNSSRVSSEATHGILT